MSATQTPTRRSRVSTETARVRGLADAHRLDHIAESLEAAQKDLASIGGSVGTGVRDLRRDATRLLRDARRDLAKMRRSIERDLERLQRDLTSAAAGKPAARATRPTARTARRQTAH